jgi:predicted phosphodiesterase
MTAKKVLALSDVELDLIYSPRIREKFQHIDLIIGCGDLPYYYLEYIVSVLNKPLYFVRGNHSNIIEYSSAGAQSEPMGRVIFTKVTVPMESFWQVSKAVSNTGTLIINILSKKCGTM